jgi:hypothetical protein
MNTLNFPYRPNPWKMLLACVFFAGCALVMGSEAIFDDRGLIIDRVIRLGPSEARTFNWCVAAISAAFVPFGIFAFCAGLWSGHQLSMSQTELSVPSFLFSQKPTIVKLADIQRVNLRVIKKRRFLNILYSGGKLTISESLLPSPAAFEELFSAIAHRVPERTKR